MRIPHVILYLNHLFIFRLRTSYSVFSLIEAKIIKGGVAAYANKVDICAVMGLSVMPLKLLRENMQPHFFEILDS